MIELAARQRHDGYRQLFQLRVVELRVSAKATAEVGIEVVKPYPQPLSQGEGRNFLSGKGIYSPLLGRGVGGEAFLY